MKIKAYLLFLIIFIMAAGGRTMFEVAKNGAMHDTKDTLGFGPDSETWILIGLAVWYLLMMSADVLLLNYPSVKNRALYIALLSGGVFVPAIYMFATH
ncbi:MAG: hypothetical protein JST49_06265 [Bacteroidetes bacterium]|nr:hypothetical protein [Bacteroidota bacterium]